MKRLVGIFGALLLASSLPATSFAASTKQFSDVPQTKHFAEAVYDLAERNIIGGYPDGTFKPGNSITRGQAAAIIAKMTNLDTSNVKNSGFKDVSTANGYYKAIGAMARQRHHQWIRGRPVWSERPDQAGADGFDPCQSVRSATGRDTQPPI